LDLLLSCLSLAAPFICNFLKICLTLFSNYT
jgi:hypothetical protein